MSDQAVNVRVVAQTGDLSRGMAEAPKVVEQATSRMRGAFAALRQETSKTLSDLKGDITDSVRGMAGSFGGLVDVLGTTKGGFLALAGVLAAVGFSKTVTATAQATESVMDMARALGVTTNEASFLQAALEDVGAEPGEFQAAAKGLSRQLKENEADLNKLGLATRDAAGNFRPMTDLVVDGIAVLGQYAEGADRNIAAQAMFGRGIDASSRLLLLNREAIDENRAAVQELGLEVGQNSVAAWKEFDAAGDRAALSLKGMARAVGQTLMPVMTDLVSLFNAVMPAAIVVVRGALSGLTAAFLFVKNGVLVLWETINAMVITVAEPLRAIGEAVGRALVGDFKGAAAAIKGVPDVIVGAWGSAFDRMTQMSQETSDKVSALFGADTGAGDPGGLRGTKTAPQLGGKEKKEKANREKSEVDKSKMAVYLEELEQEKLVQAKRNALREFDKEQELAFWQSKLAGTDLIEKDRLNILTRTAKLEIDILRDKAKQGAALNMEEIKAAEDRAMASVAAAELESRGEYEAHRISYSRLLDLEQQHEQQKFEIRKQALQARLQTVDPDRDPVMYAQILAQIEQLEAQHQIRKREIQLAGNAEMNSVIGSVWQATEQAMARAIEGMINRTMTLRQAMASIWASIRATIVKEISAIIAKKIAAWAVERGLALMGIGTKAVEAGAGAASSMASIPYVGPILAIAALAAVMGSVNAAKSSVPSARSGFDIPAGMNPMTQLHEREMVLPAPQADVIRDMATGGSGGVGGMPALTINLSALDGADVARVLMRSPEALGKAMKAAVRDAHFTPKDLR